MFPKKITLTTIAALLIIACSAVHAADPPPINPFGRKPNVREDALPGYVEMSDGRIQIGQIYLTRGKKLKVYDPRLRRQKEIPLSAVKQIECEVAREWIEREWRFKEPGNPEKVYSGRAYPAREYRHQVTLHDGRTITGSLSAIVYVEPPANGGRKRPPAKPERFVLHKRHKGPMGDKLKSLVYVKRIKLGEEALVEGRKKAAAGHRSQSN